MSHSFKRWQSAFGLLGSLAFVAIAAFEIRNGAGTPLDWFCVLFFGACGLGCGYLVITGRPNIARFQPEEFRIVLDSGGFAILTTRNRRFDVRWEDVRRVRAYKRDLLTTDEICVVFEAEGGVAIRVSEEWPGFQELFHVMDQKLGINPEWFGEIMLPPFEAMHRVLFERAG